jgi:hypothetical protein
VAATGLRIKRSAVTISSAMSFAMTILRAKNFTVSMSSAFTMTPVPVEDMLKAFTNISITAKKYKGIVGLTLASTSSLTLTTLDRIAGNLTIPRTYEVNADRQLFAAGSPVIYNPNPGGSDTYTIELTAEAQTSWPTIDNSQWFNSTNEPAEFAPDQTSTPDTFYTYTGTLAQVNSHFATIRFLPPFMGVEFQNQGFAFPTQNVTYRQYKNGTLQFTTTLALTAFGDGDYADDTIDTYTVSGSTTGFTWTPVNHQLKYADLNILLVAGGGAGGGVTGGGGGGGGGGVARRYYLQPEKLVYTFNIGLGGRTTFNSGDNGTDTYYGKGATYPGTEQLRSTGGIAGTSAGGGTSGGPNANAGGGNANGAFGGGGSRSQAGSAPAVASPNFQRGGNGAPGVSWFQEGNFGPGGGGGGRSSAGAYLPGSAGSGQGGIGGQGGYFLGGQIGVGSSGGNGLVKVYVRKRQQDPSVDL